MLRHLILIGDIHAKARRLGHVLSHARSAAPDAVLSVGDIVDGPEDVDECVALLQDHGVLAVRGNHERWLAEGDPITPFMGSAATLAWLSALPPTRTFDAVGGPLLLGHGVGDDDMQRLRPEDEGYALSSNFALESLLADGCYRWLIGGHTHAPMVRRFGRLTVLNPGTLCRDDSPGFLAVDLGAHRGQWFHVDLAGVTAGRVIDLRVDDI